MKIIENKREIQESFSAYDAKGSINSIRGIEVQDIKDLKKIYIQKKIDPDTYGYSFIQGVEDVVRGFSERCDRIFVNIDEGLVQGYIFPFVITATVSSNEYKAFYTIKQIINCRSMDKLDNFSSVLAEKVLGLGNFIRKNAD